MNIEDERRGKWAVLLSNCPSRHMTLYRFHQIQIELLIGELYNQVRCDRHSRQLYGSVAGNSGDVFFATCFRQFMIFCAKFYFSAQMAIMAIGNANPAIQEHPVIVNVWNFQLSSFHTCSSWEICFQEWQNLKNIKGYNSKSYGPSLTSFFYPVPKRETNWNFTGCQMPMFMRIWS